MKENEISKLLIKYKAGTASPEEIAFLENWYTRYREAPPDEYRPEQLLTDAALVKKNLQRKLFNRRKPIFTGLSAAAALLLVALSVYHTWKQHPQSEGPTATVDADVSPGTNKATLTLADGRMIDLSSDQEGIIVGADAITYADGTGLIENSTLNLQLSTPKGGQYQIVLEDGTKVWLNAASTLSYPSKFTGARREVRLNGEAFFEIAKNKSKPFVVKSKNQEILVLATTFNLNTYEDEATVRTTLLEGKIQVKAENPALNTYVTELLSPGEQSVLSANGTLSKHKADIARELAWKNGLFDFTGKNLEQVMRELERWYDIEVFFEGSIPDDKFLGKIYRDNNLSMVLRILKSAEVNYRIAGKQLFITDK